ncbi:unnamed protein product [Caenorhabditis auriculariae]|uniref:Uncharacterized protein n=1 Tax=Caenorhabditis auriculariae TaxID=2777116 RepID=A0A8S1HLT0_9PELO|nr:unnamed protein product [Caenorhabditis auriculariae]
MLMRHLLPCCDEIGRENLTGLDFCNNNSLDPSERKTKKRCISHPTAMSNEHGGVGQCTSLLGWTEVPLRGSERLRSPLRKE